MRGKLGVVITLTGVHVSQLAPIRARFRGLYMTIKRASNVSRWRRFYAAAAARERVFYVPLAARFTGRESVFSRSSDLPLTERPKTDDPRRQSTPARQT